jgi:microcystin-dependent protein
MPLNKLDSIIKNTEGRILYVSPSDLDSTDSISNQGNSLARPFKTIQRALIESARFSYIAGNNNDETEKTTILLMPGDHVVDNRPGYTINSSGNTTTPDGSAFRDYPFSLDSVFDLTQKDNDLYKFNSVNGGVIVPRGTSVVGLDLRKTKIRPLYIPNPTDDTVPSSAVFRITGACYFWQFSIFDGDEFGTVYTQNNNFELKSSPTFSHHKLTVFEYADGVNEVENKGVTDLNMYYAKLSRAYGAGSGRSVDINDLFPGNKEGFTSVRPEFEIVGAFASDPIQITSITSGDGLTPTRRITVTTQNAHGLDVGTPIRIKDVSDFQYNISTRVTEVSTISDNVFFYTISSDPSLITPTPTPNQGTVTIETDTVSGASPYVFNVSMRSVWGMNGMLTDGSKATGFRSMVVAQFTGISLQKDDRAFVKYVPSSRQYENTFYSTTTQTGSELSSNSSSSGIVYHLDSDSIYRKGWEQTHIKMTNDAIVQIVSVFAIGYNKHFEAKSGGDASVTNSNSNFGQLSLISEGFKKEAFEKDDKSFITHIIPPRALHSTEEDIDWLTLDQDATNTSTKLYIFGFKNQDVKPPVLTQGYRVGAKVNDKLFLGIGLTTYSADILMPDGSSSFKEYPVTSGPSSNIFTIGTHDLTTGEKVIIISDDGDLPENLRTNTVYFAIKVNATTIKLAASQAEADADEPITVFGGTNLKIITRVSDKQSGDAGHPVQYDESANQWFINVSSTGNTITGELSGTGASESTIIKRIPDDRSLDEKIYKVRVVVPSQLSNAKTPEAGFVIQESSTTGFVGAADTNRTTIDTTNYDYNRNPSFISTCSFSSPTVTVLAELPHNLKVGDSVTIKNVTDSTNTSGLIDKGYNGTYSVSEITDDITFKYTTTLTPGSFTNNVNDRTTSLPRFERTDLKSNIYVYRNEIISEYSDGDSNGVYHIYALNSNNAIQDEFTHLKYSQNVTDLYPQLDRDNPNDDPNSATTYALRSPLGEVQTDDLKKSITRESADLLLTSLGIGLDIASVTNPTSTTPTIVFDKNHKFNRVVSGSLNASTSGFTPGTYFNVKISTVANPISSGVAFDSAWNGLTAKVVVASGGNISSAEIMNGSSNYSAGTYYLDTRIIGAGTNNDFTITSADISSPVGDVVQFTGIGTGTDTYHRITGVTAKNSISIARTTGDPVITSDNYAFVTAPSIEVSSKSFSNGIITINTTNAHGLAVGNKFRIINSSNQNRGDFIVGEVVDFNTFTFNSENNVTSAGSGSFICKHGLSSNAGVSDKTNENLQERAITIFDGETLTLSSNIDHDPTTTTFSVSSPGIAGTMTRFPLGSYIQIDNEIMRIASDSLSGVPADQITVIRGALATSPETHVQNSIIKKIKVPSIEFHRPSIIRASGHTFEYLGYGPGNYSTALPQVQNKTITEREEFLSQSQERSGGLVVYTGMNNKGDFFIGNQKKSSATGEETNFDIPVSTITGEDPSRLSAVFDEVTVKERLVVEGGDSGQVLSQFDGPVTFSKDVRIKEELKVTGNTTLKNLSSTTNILTINDNVDVDGTITADQFITTTPSFTNLDGNDIYHLLRSNGTQSLITSSEINNALGYVPANQAAVTDATFPLGNSILVDDISSQFNGSLTNFALSSSGLEFIPAGSSANLIVSLGGVIQKPGLDYLIVQNSDGNTSTIRFTTAPLSGTTSFIIGLGGQGSLLLNQDYNNKGEIFVATGNNAALALPLGENGYVLTAKENEPAGVSWQPSVPIGSVFYIASGTTPPGYLFCNGQTIPTSGSGTIQGIDASLLQDLRTLLGTTYGANGQLPDLRNRFAGYSATPGAAAGSADAVLIAHDHGVSNDSHNHGVTDPGHFHSISGFAVEDNVERTGQVIIDDDRVRDTVTIRSTGINTTGVTVDNEATGITINTKGINSSGNNSNSQTGTNANLPPYLGMRPIIKY